MTTQTTTRAARTIATTLADLLGLVEEMVQAHDALVLPDHEDLLVDWDAIIMNVDALGEASHKLATVAQERMIPALKSMKGHAKTALTEITTLNRLAEAFPGA